MNNLDLVHENNDYLVVNKQAGLISEKNPFEALTVENQVQDHLLKNKPKPFIGVIHRLDRVTSGVLLFAKRKSILVQFNGLFSDRKIKKTYLAIVKEKPLDNKRVITNFLVKNKQEKKAVIVHSKSKDAQLVELSYQVLDKNDFGYLLEIEPKTGRFHQIRAQLAHIGLSIIGDEKYGSKEEYLPLSVCLHAWKLSYPAFDSKKRRSYEAPLPKNDFWKF